MSILVPAGSGQVTALPTLTLPPGEAGSSGSTIWMREAGLAHGRVTMTDPGPCT